MIDDDRQVGAHTDLDRLGNRLFAAERLAAHVRDVATTVPRGNLGQCHQLVGGRERRGRIDQSARQSEAASAHGRVQDGRHLQELVACRRTVLDADDLAANLVDRCERTEVDRRPASFLRPQIAIERVPPDLEPELPRGLLVELIRGPQPRRAPLADDFRGDALPNVALARAIGEERRPGLPLNVDEARRHDLSGSIHLATTGPPREIAHCHDAVTHHPDVGWPRRRAATVDDLAIPDDEVQVDCGRRGAGASAHGGHEDAARRSHSHTHNGPLDPDGLAAGHGCVHAGMLTNLPDPDGQQRSDENDDEQPRQGAIAPRDQIDQPDAPQPGAASQ